MTSCKNFTNLNTTFFFNIFKAFRFLFNYLLSILQLLHQMMPQLWRLSWHWYLPSLFYFFVFLHDLNQYWCEQCALYHCWWKRKWRGVEARFPYNPVVHKYYIFSLFDCGTYIYIYDGEREGMTWKNKNKNIVLAQKRGGGKGTPIVEQRFCSFFYQKKIFQLSTINLRKKITNLQ